MNQNNYTDAPEWLHDWRIRQEAERQRLQELDISHPGAPLPDPPSRPPKRPELGLKVKILPTNLFIIQFNDVLICTMSKKLIQQFLSQISGGTSKFDKTSSISECSR